MSKEREFIETLFKFLEDIEGSAVGLNDHIEENGSREMIREMSNGEKALLCQIIDDITKEIGETRKRFLTGEVRKIKRE